MPKCKNDASKTYIGNEPSPTGLGFCAKGEIVGDLREGKDGNTWKVIEDKNGRKRWVKSSLKNFFSLEMFFQVTVIPPEEVNNYLQNNVIFEKIRNEIIPKLNSKEIKVYLIPLPLSDNGIYWSDYADSYLNKFYGQKHFDEEYIKITIYFDNDLILNINRDIKINYNLNQSNQQIVYDTFRKHLPYNFNWSGIILESMTIQYEKSKNKAKKLVVKNLSYYPIASIHINIKKSDVSLFDQEPLEAKELKLVDMIKKNCLHIEYEYDMENLFLTFYGVKNLELVEKLIKYLENEKNLTYYAIKYKINKITSNIAKNEDDYGNNLLS